MRTYMLQHVHPAKFAAEILGLILGTYFLWIHNWIGAVIRTVILFLGSTIALWNKPIENLAESALGRIMLVLRHALQFCYLQLKRTTCYLRSLVASRYLCRCRLLPIVIAPSLGLEKIVPVTLWTYHDSFEIGFLGCITFAAMKATPRP